MSRPIAIPPTSTKETGPMKGVTKTHPAYGMLRFARIQGKPGTLFGSEVKTHGSFIRLSIHPGEEKWSLSQSWFHGRAKTLVEVDLSAAQFAEAITSMNVGMGVPCTLRYLDGQKPIAYIEDESTVHEQIKADVKDTAKEAVDRIKALHAAIAEAKLPKGVQNKLLELARSAAASLDNSLPFVLDQYGEALETMRSKAATEVDAMFAAAIQRAGIKALGGGDAPPTERLT